MLATRMGAKAIEILENDEGGVMVGLENHRLIYSSNFLHGWRKKLFYKWWLD